MNTLQAQWHKFMYMYKQALYNSCLDETLRDKLQQQIEYHQMKVMEYCLLKA